MIKAGVYGARNEVTATLVKILLFHPDVNLVWVCDGQSPTRLDKLYPWLTGDTNLETVGELPEGLDMVDVILLARVPDDAVLNALLLNDAVKVIDLTGRYNLDDDVTYGLGEINRKIIVHDCFKVAIPDAVAHVIELALLPLAKNLMITTNVAVQVDCDACDIAVTQQEVCRLLKGVQSSFMHDVSITRETPAQDSSAIIVTATLGCRTDMEVLRDLYENYFDDHNFTFIVDYKPQASHVLGTNKCLLHLERTGQELQVTAAIDGRLKGRAGNAVHILNLLFGLHERVGLETF